jgi:thiamine biosynthesis lipoprotein
MIFFTSREIDVMNTKLNIVIISDNNTQTENIIDGIEKNVKDFEIKFSRFLDSSELSKLNKSTENKIYASKEMVKLLSIAKSFYKKTNKIFDPTILNILEEIGYDKSFEFIKDHNLGKNSKKNTDSSVSFDDLKINTKDNTITKPKEMKLDLGGMGKGYIVDNIVKKLYSSNYNNFWISIGGDIFLSGKDEKGNDWEIGIQNPLKHDQDLLKIRCTNKNTAIATSGITKRKWGDIKNKFHHIIDPRTKASVKNDILSVTVISNNTTKADIFAKTVLILGKEKGIEFINKKVGSECVLIDKNLDIFLSKNIDKCLTKI